MEWARQPFSHGIPVVHRDKECFSSGLIDLGKSDWFSVQFKSYCLDIELLYEGAWVDGCRQDIDPAAKWCLYGKMGRSVKYMIHTLTLPIVFKQYQGKSQKFYLFLSLRPSWIFSVCKNDWAETLSKEPGYEWMKLLLQDKWDEISHGRRVRDYDNDPAYQQRIKAFKAAWAHKDFKDRWKFIPVRNLSAVPCRLGFDFGIEYEMDNGLILNWRILSLGLNPCAANLTTGLTIGFNFAKCCAKQQLPSSI